MSGTEDNTLNSSMLDPQDLDKIAEHRRRAEAAFCEELTALINKYSMENGSDTPDFILGQYLVDCLKAYDVALVRREHWYGRTG